uniref:Uncharacterized protein n=1 Tax=Eptatretus burgeri TaxID=7764 RepID=A0A8C4NLA8_EPTBU
MQRFPSPGSRVVSLQLLLLMVMRPLHVSARPTAAMSLWMHQMHALKATRCADREAAGDVIGHVTKDKAQDVHSRARRWLDSLLLAESPAEYPEDDFPDLSYWSFDGATLVDDPTSLPAVVGQPASTMSTLSRDARKVSTQPISVSSTAGERGGEMTEALMVESMVPAVTAVVSQAPWVYQVVTHPVVAVKSVLSPKGTDGASLSWVTTEPSAATVTVHRERIAGLVEVPYHLKDNKSRGFIVKTWVHQFRNKSALPQQVHYLSGVLIPFGIGVLGAICILLALYGLRCAAKHRLHRGIKRCPEGSKCKVQ